MRKLLIGVLLLASCAEPSTGKEETPVDSLSSKQESSDTLPGWLTKIYNTERDTSEFGMNRRQEVETYVPVNDSVAYCILVVSTNNCMEKLLVTLVNRKQKQEMEIEQGCDSDLSAGSYSWKDVVKKGPRDFEVTEYTDHVADSLLDEQGFIKQEINKDRLELDTKTDSTKHWLRVTDTGEIVERK